MNPAPVSLEAIMADPGLSDARGTLPRLLVSVRGMAEAEAALFAGADLIDAKDPDRGALGSLEPPLVRDIVSRIGSLAITSAVAGETAEADATLEAVSALARTGVSYVKLGLRPTVRLDREALALLAAAAPGRLIAVLFAEDDPAPGLPALLAAAGFCGAMIDTAGKDGRRLPDLLGPPRLAAFTASCRAHGLICGLAGSLRIADIRALAAHRPDYLGFRGGLCPGGDRRRDLDAARIAEAVRTVRGLDSRDAA